MTAIRIVACPPGEAPQAIREAWIGLELPFRGTPWSHRRLFLTSGVVTGPRTLWQRLLYALRGRLAIQSGYAVNALEAVNILATKDAAAARWWREHGAHLLDGKRNLLFIANVCEECR